MEEKNNKKFSIKNMFKSRKNIAIIILSFLLFCTVATYANSETIDFQLQIDKLNNEFSELKGENELLKKQISNLKDENNKLQEDKNNIEKSNKKLYEDIHKLEENNTSLTDENKSLTAELEQLKVTNNKTTTTPSPTVAPVTPTVVAPAPVYSPAQTPVNKTISNSYVLNTNTKKFHYSSCVSVKQMKESNKRFFTGSRDEVISQGYSPCQKCNP